MKIGFDLQVFTGGDRVPDVFTTDKRLYGRIRNLFVELDVMEHELFVFCSQRDNEQNELNEKRKFLKVCMKKRIPPFRFAFVDKNDIRGAVKRNHIDIFITSDKALSEHLLVFTDTVYYTTDMEFSSLILEIKKIVQKNRMNVIPMDSVPNGLPSEDRLWLQHYRIGDYKWNKESMSPYDRMTISNQDWLDEKAMEFFNREFTYGEFFERVEHLADVMYEDGIRKGVRVPLILVNTPESLITLYALYKLKATVIPIFPLSTKEDIKNKLEEICDRNKAEGFNETKLFISELVYNRFSEVIPNSAQAIVLAITASMPKMLSIAFRYIVMPKMGIKSVEYTQRTIAFDEYYKRNVKHHGEIDTSFDDTYTAVQLYTGGTIKPKGVMLSEGNIDCASKQFYNDRFAFRRGDKIAAFMPLNHSFGLIIGTHVAATLGVELDIIMKINFKRLDKLFLKEKVNLFGGIPNMFPAIRNNKYFKDADLSHVKYILSGGAIIDETERQRTTEFFKNHNSMAEVHDGYGLTESAGGVIYDGIPNMGTDVKVVDTESGCELGYEELGELCMSGVQVMRGYDDASLDKGVLRQHDDGRIWLHTGDNAVIHKDGRVQIIGRKDRMIKVNGEQVSLDDIEELINSLSFVEKSVVVKCTDTKRGYVPVAFLKLAPDQKWDADKQEIIDNLYNEKLTAYARPRKTTIIEELPVTTVGKVDFRALEKRAEQDIV